MIRFMKGFIEKSQNIPINPEKYILEATGQMMLKFPHAC